MATDRECLHQRALLRGEGIRWVQLLRADEHSFGHSAIGHDAEDFEILATVGASAPAREAFAAVHVRLDRTAIAGLHIRGAVADGEHLHAELMAWDSWVGKERHLAEISREIRAADADAIHPDERLPMCRRRGFGNVNTAKTLRLFELNGFHGKVERRPC